MTGSEREYSSGGLVHDGGKVLLVKVKNLSGRIVWTFPKGHLEKGETHREAALREVREETGWRCRALERLLVARYRFRRDGRPVAKSVRWYLMEPRERVGTPDEDEVLDCRWMPVREALRRIRYPSDKSLLRTFMRRRAEEPKTDGR